MPQVTLDSASRGPSLYDDGRPYDYVVVGAGFAGSVIAERLAEGLGLNVLVIDRREHIGGNAYDHFDEAGILVHRYGPHIFHTNAQRIVDYLSRFTQWRTYEHRVLAKVDEHLVPIPINLTTLNTLFGLQMDEAQAERFLAERAQPVECIRTSEDVVINQIGQELYQKFFQGYTRKQWGLDPSQLDKSVTSRIPTRTNDDDRYFTDTFQAMPLDGYTRMFECMLDHPRIDVLLDSDFAKVREQLSYAQLIYCGPVDEYFDFSLGRLPYRSLRFEHQTLQQSQLQAVAVVNYPDEKVPYTRITEYKHLTGQEHPLTSITYEYPCAEGDPYYPIPRAENAQLYQRYKALADETPGVTFLGRLGTYKYYNMDQVVGQALALYQRIEQQGQPIHEAQASSPLLDERGS